MGTNDKQGVLVHSLVNNLPWAQQVRLVISRRAEEGQRKAEPALILARRTEDYHLRPMRNVCLTSTFVGLTFLSLLAPASNLNSAPDPQQQVIIAKAAESEIPDVKPLVSVKAQVCAVSFDPMGHSLVVGGYKEALVFSLKEIGAQPVRLDGPIGVVQSLAFSCDGRLLAAGGGLPARSGEVILWDMQKGTQNKVIHGHADIIHSVKFSPDGKLLASASYDRLIKLWDVETGKEWKTLKDHVDAVYPVAFSPNGRWLVSGSADRSVKIWDVNSGLRLLTLTSPLEPVLTLAFHPTKNVIAVAGGDRRVRLFLLSQESGTEIQSILAHAGSVLQVVFSKDGKQLISGGTDRSVKVWDSESGRLIKTLESQTDWVMALDVSPDGRWLAVGNYDGAVRLYDLSTGVLLKALIEPPPVPVAGKSQKTSGKAGGLIL